MAQKQATRPVRRPLPRIYTNIKKYSYAFRESGKLCLSFLYRSGLCGTAIPIKTGSASKYIDEKRRAANTIIRVENKLQ
jgi:hypothetical protein